MSCLTCGGVACRPRQVFQPETEQTFPHAVLIIVVQRGRFSEMEYMGTSAPPGNPTEHEAWKERAAKLIHLSSEIAHLSM